MFPKFFTSPKPIFGPIKTPAAIYAKRRGCRRRWLRNDITVAAMIAIPMLVMKVASLFPAAKTGFATMRKATDNNDARTGIPVVRTLIIVLICPVEESLITVEKQLKLLRSDYAPARVDSS